MVLAMHERVRRYEYAKAMGKDVPERRHWDPLHKYYGQPGTALFHPAFMPIPLEDTRGFYEFPSASRQPRYPLPLADSAPSLVVQHPLPLEDRSALPDASSGGGPLEGWGPGPELRASGWDSDEPP